MVKPKPAPPRLTSWIDGSLDRIDALVREGKQVSNDDQTEYLLTQLKTFAAVETAARRAVHLLTAHTIRTGATTATAVARASGVTLTAAQSRAGSALAQEVTAEAWPRGTR